MKRLDLIRCAYFPFGVYGKFLCGTDWLATVEKPWLQNSVMWSCIPEGDYICKPSYYNKHNYAAVEVTNVPGRKNILFHIANWPSDVEGCIGVGKRIGCLTKNSGSTELAVTNSTQAFKEFMSFYGGEDFELHIRQITGGRLIGN